jgi:hypothetical protein
MDWGQIILVYSRLILGAVAVFLAIMLWSKTRDAAWMLIVAGTITAYIEIVYSVVELLGFTAISGLVIGSVPLTAILLPSLRMILFSIAFLIMIMRRKT